MRIGDRSPQWKAFSASVKGPGHVRLNRPNQDRELTRPIGDGGTWLYAVADGAGSRSRSDLGASFAVDAAHAAAEQIFGPRLPESPEDWSPALQLFARECLERFERLVAAQTRGILGTTSETAAELRSSFATTLLAVIAAPPYFGYISVGDCFLVVDRDPGGPWLVATAPEREHAGETVFLTSHGREAHLEHNVLVDSRIRGLALCTDGLCEAMLALRKAPDGRLHPLAPPEFADYFDYFRRSDADQAELATKLLSKEFAATSGDDKTIVLVVRTS